MTRIPGTEPPSGQLERVELFDEESIVARGSAKTTWFVRVQHGWVAAATLPEAHVEPLQPAPGTVWRRRIEIQLARGTRLLRVHSAPLPQKRTPLEFLGAPRGAARRVLRNVYRVTARGVVVQDDSEPPATSRMK